MNAKSTELPAFLIAREYLDENGIWNPIDEEGTVNGGLQVNLIGTKESYLKLAEEIRKFALIDTERDSDFHIHNEGIMSGDGRTRMHLILRKDDIGDGVYSSYIRPKS